MTNEEIRDECLSQCNSYLDYITSFTEHHGKYTEKVYSIKYQDGSSPKLYEIKLEKSIYDFESIYFKNNVTGDIYFNKKDVVIIEYDQKNKLLYIQIINQEIDLNKLQPHEFLIVVDLTFLITNLIEWYSKHSKELKLSEIKSYTNTPNVNNLIGASLNQKQILAVNTIFNNTYSYIWGPPGTGKTRAVLSCAAINYIKSNKKILIIAPTNVALEQVMYGILENSTKLHIPNEKFLRIGTPSKKFLEMYPEICETKGLQKEISFCDNELHILERVIKYRQGKEITADLEVIGESFSEILDNKDEIKRLEENIENLEPLIRLCTQPLKDFHFTNGSKLIKDAIKKRTDSECVKYDDFLIENNELSKVIDLECIRNEIKRYEKKISKIDNQNFEILQKSKSFAKSEKIYNEIFKDLDENNFKAKRLQINNKIKTLRDWATNWKIDLQNDTRTYNDILIDEALNEHHIVFDIGRLNARKEEILNKKLLLLAQTTKLRIQGSQVVAMTIDGYIQYTLKDSISVDHIFCDEAGYMSNIKALTLFRSNSPITFLGDHMQLPPVSEVRNDDFRWIEKTFLWRQSSIYCESIFIKNSIQSIYNEFNESSNPNYQQVAQSNLDITHRFGSNLASLLDRFVYKFGFQSSAKNPTEIISVHSHSNPLDAIERSSMYEASIIKRLVSQYNVDDFVILTPYNKQVNLLKKTLGMEYNNNIMTIHKSQGSEWDTVIFSVVDDSINGKRGMFFTNSLNLQYHSLNLINTVVSRAKRKLIIVSNTNFWLKDINNQLIGSLIAISQQY